MVLEMETESRDVIVMALEKFLSSNDFEVSSGQLNPFLKNSDSLEMVTQSASSLIKTNMDKKFGGPWHVIIGEGFGFDIVHQARQLIHIHYQNVSCLCYKC